MSKQYGLILTGKSKPKESAHDEIKKPSVFDEDSSSEDESIRPQLKQSSVSIGPGATEKRLAKKIHDQALAEDPTVFQYDELYDDIEAKRIEAKNKTNECKKPKYIGRLLECADKRKLENERRIERMMQKELEKEGDEFKDKESFVTASYRKKLEEMRKAEEQEKREDYLEAIGDVTKQKDLDGFYRHIYEQKVGPKENKQIEKPSVESPKSEEEHTEFVSKKGLHTKQRAYRKRKSSRDNSNSESETEEPVKRCHIQSNLDADSDFSIDSSSSEDEDKNETIIQNKNETIIRMVENEEKNKDERPQEVEKQTNGYADDTDIKENGVQRGEVSPLPQKPKIDRSLIWKKRTVGEVFEAALQRYFQRKAARQR